MRAPSPCLLSAGLAGLLCACSNPTPASPDLRTGEERDLPAAPVDQAGPADLAGSGCSAAKLVSTGGAGRLYCFAK